MRRLWIVASILFVMLSAGWLTAMMVQIPLEQLVQEAELIIVGRVESVEGRKQGSMIRSLAVLKAERVLKGTVAPRERITVEFEGGRAGEETLVIEDSPNYQPGEEVVVFIKKLPESDVYKTVGQFQGKYLIRDKTVLREKQSLDAFLQRIEAILHPGRP